MARRRGRVVVVVKGGTPGVPHVLTTHLDADREQQPPVARQDARGEDELRLGRARDRVREDL
jgi:hypothetical protein